MLDNLKNYHCLSELHPRDSIDNRSDGGRECFFRSYIDPRHAEA